MERVEEGLKLEYTHKKAFGFIFDVIENLINKLHTSHKYLSSSNSKVLN